MAEGELEEFDRVAQLRSDTQEARIEEERMQAQMPEGPSPDEAAAQASVFGFGRDELDADISRFIVKAEPLELFLLGIPWFNLKLFYGQAMKKGRSKLIAPPSFKPWGLDRLVPKQLSWGLIIFFDLLLAFLVIPSLIIDAMLLYLIVEGLTNPLQAAQDANLLFGAFGRTLVQWLGFPSIL
jgi:hypothetical protein